MVFYFSLIARLELVLTCHLFLEAKEQVMDSLRGPGSRLDTLDMLRDDNFYTWKSRFQPIFALKEVDDRL